MLNLRSVAKQVLKGMPYLQRPAKRLYEQYKRREDARRVLASHPKVELINFPKREIEALHAKGYKSQYGQDYYLLTKIFTKDAPGTFVEIGANHPIKNNNSFAFEKAGWTGWAFDPLSNFQEQWKSQRKTPFFNAAISDEAGTRRFVEFKGHGGWEHQLSGFAGSVRDEDLKVHSHKTYEINCYPLYHFIPNVTHIDLALIDVEGAELFVIAGLGLKKIRIDWILVENVMILGGDEKVRKCLAEYGYVFRARIASTDDLFQLIT